MGDDKKNYLFKRGIFGLVVADALGVPYEFGQIARFDYLMN